MDFDHETLQTLLAHIKAAVCSGGVPVATLVEMLVNLPACVSGPFPTTREIVETVVRQSPSVLFVDAHDKVHIRLKYCEKFTGMIEKHLRSAFKKLDTTTCFYNVKGHMTQVMTSYRFATVQLPRKAVVFVHKVYVENGRLDGPNRLGLMVGDIVAMDIVEKAENGTRSTATFDTVRVRLLEAAPQPVHNSRPHHGGAKPYCFRCSRHVKHNSGDSQPACNAASTSTVPHANNEQLSDQNGVIHSLDRNSGIIIFGS
ncbi:hypothetical protein MRX96_042390 [Rhipicephalus microplus]